ncbi:hypothetical protein BBJ28_00001872 [Nothophytophthora sp. Chile5]|nr:hypothetical protein BBJ28_00001872 [Nothophytophthora sp. Chile5]
MAPDLERLISIKPTGDDRGKTHASAQHAARWGGNEALRGKLLGSGPIMKKIDLLVSEICWMVAQQTVVTVAFDTFNMLRPVFHGDFIRLEGRALSINKSSIVCQVSVYRHDFASDAFQLTHNAVVTFVAIGGGGGALPELFDPQKPVACEKLRALAQARKELSAQWRKQQDEVAAMGTIAHAMIPSLPGKVHAARVLDIQSTILETRNNFLPKHANQNGNVFGGVLLDWMCARNFTKNYSMVTVGMNRVHFKLPINLDNLVSIRARIEIVVYRVELPDNIQALSHTGCFEVLNLEEDNQRRREIHLGVTAKESDQDGMQALLKAYRRHLFERQDAELLGMAPIPLSVSRKFLDAPAPRL